MERITWSEAEVEIKTLRPYPHNPRYIKEEAFEKLLDSITHDGYHARIKVTKDLTVIGGHQRLKALKQLGYESIPVLVASRELTEKEFQRILILDNHLNGEFDMDILANVFDFEMLDACDLKELSSLKSFMDDEDEEDQVRKKPEVRCPHCEAVFPVKGNKA